MGAVRHRHAVSSVCGAVCRLDRQTGSELWSQLTGWSRLQFIDPSVSKGSIPTKVDPPKAPVRLKTNRREETRNQEESSNTGEYRFKKWRKGHLCLTLRSENMCLPLPLHNPPAVLLLPLP